MKPTAAAAKKDAEKKPDDGVRKVNTQLSSVFLNFDILNVVIQTLKHGDTTRCYYFYVSLRKFKI